MEEIKPSDSFGENRDLNNCCKCQQTTKVRQGGDYLHGICKCLENYTTIEEKCSATEIETDSGESNSNEKNKTSFTCTEADENPACLRADSGSNYMVTLTADEGFDLPLNSPETHSYHVQNYFRTDGQSDFVNEVDLKLKYLPTENKKVEAESSSQEKSSLLLDILTCVNTPLKNRFHVETNVYMLNADQRLHAPVFVKSKSPNAQTGLTKDFNTEFNRLASYLNYPQNLKVFAICLAGDGFVYLHEHQSVVCNFCKLSLSVEELSLLDFSVDAIHRNRSPHCPFKNGIECGNQPVPDSSEYLHLFPDYTGDTSPPAAAVGVQFEEEILPAVEKHRIGERERPGDVPCRPGIDAARPPASAQSHSANLASSSGCSISAAMKQSPETSRSNSAKQQSSGAATPNSSTPKQQPLETLSASGASSNCTGGSKKGKKTKSKKTSDSSKTKPTASSSSAHSHKSSQSSSSKSKSAKQVKKNKSSNNTSSSTVSSGEKEGEQSKEKNKLTFSDLGIYAEKPKRPDMAVLSKRLASYSDKWKDSLLQKPKELAEAGMYFAGYADCARCFFCGGGLKNWEPQDNPWVEHARWFPKCVYVRMYRTPEFVDIVQRKNQNNEKILLRDVEYELTLKASPKEDTAGKASIPQKTSAKPLDRRRKSKADSSSKVVQPEDVESLEAENEELRSQVSCKICMDEESKVVFLPCGHLVACPVCAIALKLCPLCRAEIKGSVLAQME